MAIAVEDGIERTAGAKRSSVVVFTGEARREFAAGGFCVPTALLESRHTFSFGDHEMTLVLPPESPADAVEWSRRTRRSQWQSNDPDNPETTFHEILEVQLRATVDHSLAIESAAFDAPPKYREGSKRLADAMDATADRYAIFLGQAWDHWQAVARWVSGSARLGLSGVVVGDDAHGGRLARIYRAEDDDKIWVQMARMKATARCAFTTRKWAVLTDALAAGAEAPVWAKFMFEAQAHAASFDPDGAIIRAAIACETILRTMFWLNLPIVQQPGIRDIIDKAPVQAILSRWSDVSGLSKIDTKAWPLSDIHRLFDARNELMHSGSTDTDHDEVARFLGAADTFVKRAGKLHAERLGLVDWPARFQSEV